MSLSLVVVVIELIAIAVVNEPVWFVVTKASISVVVANVLVVLIEKPNSGVVGNDPIFGLVVKESLLYIVDNIFPVSAPNRIVFQGSLISPFELLTVTLIPQPI